MGGVSVQAQQYWIGAGGTVSDCEFYFLDDGGPFQDASNNADFTMTFCPDVPGDNLTFSFNSFNLDAGASLNVWYGDGAVGAPDASYSGTDLLGEDINNLSSGPNPTGCITWQFTSGPTGASNWNALGSCSISCDRPVATVTTSTPAGLQISPVEACIGVPVSFDASASTAAAGATIVSWFWDFGDGVTGDLGPTPDHTYTESGAYPVLLTLTDDNGCSSTNSVDTYVYVAAPISFDLPSNSISACEGGGIFLQLGPDGVSTTAVQSPPIAEFGDGVAIPEVGAAFGSSLTYSGFSPGQTITSPEDIAGIAVNLEHSFIADLTISIECPNGNSMVLQSWPGGFGGCVNAGEVGPVTTDDPPVPGVGYDYTWSSLGTDDWQTVAESLLPAATTGCAAGTPPLPSGNYAISGDWNDLLGCPINGTWTVNISDNVLGDNGTLFLWAINFNPDISPEPIEFEPTVGSDCDSSFWAPADPSWGFETTDVIGDCNFLGIQTPEEGSYEFIYTAIDAFGCQADTSVVVDVVPTVEYNVYTDALNPGAGVPSQWCAGVPLILSAAPIGAPLPGTDYSWQLDGVSSGVSPVLLPFFDLAPVPGTYEYYFQASAPAPPGVTGFCKFEWEQTIEVVEGPTAAFNVPASCSNQATTAVATSTSPTGSPLTHGWTLTAPDGTTTDFTGANPSLGFLASGDYTLLLTSEDAAGCAGSATSTFTVYEAPPLPAYSLDPTCQGEEVVVNVLNDWNGADPQWGFGGVNIANGNVATLPAVVSANAGNQTVSLTLELDYGVVTCNAPPILETVQILALPQPNWDLPGNACEGQDITISSAATAGAGPFSAEWTVTDPAGNATPSTGETVDLTNLELGDYGFELTVMDNNGCVQSINPGTLEVLETPVGTFTLDPVCEGNPIPINPIGWGTATPTWTVNGAVETVVGGLLPDAVSANPGNPVVGLVLTLTDPNGYACSSDELFQTANVLGEPDAGFTLDDVCALEPLTFTLDDPVAYAAAGSNPQWSTATGIPLTDNGGDLGTTLTAGSGLFTVELVLTADYPGQGVACTSTAQDNVFVSPLPVVDFTGNTGICLGDDLILVDATTAPIGTFLSSIQWTVDDGTGEVAYGGAGTLSLPVPAVGLYDVVLSAELNNGCTAELPIPVEVFDIPDAEFNLPAEACEGDVLPLNLIGSPGSTGNWTLDGAVWNVTGPDFPADLTLVEGTYTVSRTVGAPGSGCEDMHEETLIVHPVPVPAFTGVPQACAEDNVVWTDASNYGTSTPGFVIWDVFDGTASYGVPGNSLPFGITAAGQFDVTMNVTNGDGCEATTTGTLEVLGLPESGFTLTDVCEFEDISYVLDNPADYASGTVDWDWNGAPLNVTDPDFLPGAVSAAAGTQTLTLTVEETVTGLGCSTVTSVNVEVNPQPIAAIASPGDLCAGQDALFADATVISAGGYTIDWSIVDDAGTPFTGTDPTLNLITPPLGDYTATLTATAGACTSSDVANITVFDVPDASFDLPTSLCLNDEVPVTLTGSPGLPGTWTLDGAPWAVAGPEFPADLTATEGTFTVQRTVQAGICEDIQSVTVTVEPLPVAGLTGDLDVCAGEFVVWSDNSVNPTANLLDVEWTVDDGTALSTYNGVVLNLGNAATGTYTIAQLVTTAAGCSDTQTEVLTVNPNPVADFTLPAEVCEGSAVAYTLTDPASYAAATPTWTWNGAILPGVGAADLPPAVAADFGLQTVGLELVQTYPGVDCSSGVFDVDLLVHAQPFAAITAPTDFCAGPDAQFVDATVISDPSTTVDLTWTLDEGAGANPAGTAGTVGLTAPAAGVYTAVLMASTAAGCTSDATATFQVYPVPDATFSLPAVLCQSDVVPEPPTATGGAQVDWSTAAGPLAVVGGVFGPELTANFGVQDVTVVVTSGVGAAQCSDQYTETVTVEALPLVDISGTPAVCFGSAVAWNENSSHPEGLVLNWEWTVDDGSGPVFTTGAGYDFGTPAVGQYNVTLVAASPSGCSTDAAALLDVHPQPVADFTLGEVCAGSLIPWTASTGDFFGTETWTWNANAITATATELDPTVSANFGSPTVDVALAETYPTGITCTATASASTVVHAQPIANWTVTDVLCDDTPADFADISTVNDPAVTLATTWTVDDGTGPQQTLGSALNLGLIPAGQYTIDLVVEGNGGCQSILNENLTVYADPVPEFTLGEVCEGLPIPVIFDDPASYAASAATWTWDAGPTNEAGGFLDGALSALPGAPNVSLLLEEVHPGITCTAEATASTTVHGIPVADFSGPLDICEGESAAYTNNSTLSTGAAMDYFWTVTGPAGVTTSTLQDLAIAAPDPGNYALDLVVTGPGGCVNDASGSLDVAEGPNAAFSLPSDVCVGDVVPITPVGTGPPANPEWLLNGNPIVVTGTDLPLSVTSTPGPQTLTLQLDLTSGTATCDNAFSQSVTVHAYPVPSWDIPAELCEDGLTQYNSTSTNPDGGAIDISWEVTDPLGNAVATLTPQVDFGAPMLPGLYTVSMTATGGGGCAAAPLVDQVEVVATPNAAFTLTDVCEGVGVPWVAADITAFFNSVNTEWVWENGAPGGTPIFAIPYANLMSVVSDAPGQQTVTATLTNASSTGALLCPGSHTEVVTVYAQPVADWDVPVQICEEVPFDFTSNNTISSGAALTTTWEINDGGGPLPYAGESVQLGVQLPGAYDVEMLVVAPGGCFEQLTETVVVYDTPEAEFTLTEVCEGTPVPWQAANPAQFNVANQQTWTWNGNDAAGTATDLDPGVSAFFGDQTVTVLLENIAVSGYVCSDTYTETVTVHAVPTVGWDVIPDLCASDPVAFSSSNSIASGAALTTTWTVDLGAGPQNFVGDNLDLGWVTPGNYPVQMTAEGPGGCGPLAPLGLTVTVNPAPDADFTLSEVCEGTAIPWSLTSPGPMVGVPTWTWNGNPITATAAELDPAVSADFGPQDVTLTLDLFVSPTLTCSNTATASVLVHAVPEATWDVEPSLCEEDALAFTATVSIDSNEPLNTNWTVDLGAGPVTYAGEALNLAALPMGSYPVSLTVEGPGQCFAAPLNEVVTVYDTPVADFSLTDVCEGTAIPYSIDNFPQFFGSGQWTGANWTWNGAAISPTFTELPAAVSNAFGMQTIEVSIVNDLNPACADTHTETVEVYAIPVAGWTATADLCEEEPLDVSNTSTLASGAALTTTWTVDDGSGPNVTTSPDLTLGNQPPGVYDLTMVVEGPGGCQSPALSQAVTVHDTPVADFTLTDACEGSPIGWTADDPAQFVGATSWWWNGNALSPSPTDLDPVVSATFGTQTVEVTLDNAAYPACSDTHTETVEVYAIPVAGWTATADLCEEEPLDVTNTSTLASGDPWVAIWTVDDGSGPNITLSEDLMLGNQPPGTYDLTMVVEGLGGCQAPALTETVTVHDTPVADFSLVDACEGTPIGWVADDPAQFVGVTTWLWNGTALAPSPAALDPVVSAAFGTQTVEVTLENAAYPTCFDTHEETVEVLANPLVNWDVPVELCEGDPADFSDLTTLPTAGNWTATWTVDDGTGPVTSTGSSLTLGIPDVGTYDIILDVSTDEGCAGQVAAPLEVQPTPAADFTVQDVCAGTDIPWTALDPAGQFGVANWTWNGNSILVTGPDLPSQVSAAFGVQNIALTLEQAYATLTCASSGAAQAEVYATPVPGWDAVAGLCEGEEAVFNSTTTLASGAPMTLTWTFTDGASNQQTVADQVDLGDLPVGNYTLTLDAVAEGGCASALTTALEVHANPVADFLVQDVCAGSPVPLSVTPYGAGVTPNWTWNGAGINVAGNTLPPVVSNASGVQQITLNLVENHPDGASCSDVATATVEVFAVPVAAVTADTLWCADEAVQLEQAATGTGALDYTWTAPFGNAAGPIWDVPAGTSGIFPVILEVESEGGCSDAVVFELRIDPVPEVNLSEDFVAECAPFQGSLEAAVSGYNGVLYSTVWSWAGEDSTATSWNETVEVGSLPVTCTVTAGDAELTCSGSATATFLGVETPVADFDFFPEEPTVRDDQVQFVSSSIGEVDALSWTVEGVEEGQFYILDHSFPPYFGDLYTVCLDVVNDFGCEDRFCREVEVIGDVQVYVPAAFTPNNDGVNDIFLPSVTPFSQVEDYQFDLFNRWGERIFSTDDPNKGWGGEAPEGTHFVGNEVYNWVIVIDTELGQPYKLTGQVTMIR